MIRKLTTTTLIGAVLGVLALGVFRAPAGSGGADRADAGGVPAVQHEHPRLVPVIRREWRLEDSTLIHGLGRWK